MKTTLTTLLALALFAGTANAATYTWIGGGDVDNKFDPLNWTGGSVIPTSEADAVLVFDPVSGGNILNGASSSDKMTVGTITNNAGSNLSIRNFGNWNSSSQTGLIFDTGDASNAVVDVTNRQLETYYTPQTLNVDVEVVGGKWIMRAYASGGRWGVRGTGGYIINSGAELEIDPTHGSDSFAYSGGVTIMSGGLVDLDAEMGSLGTGLLTIHEGGHLQGVNTVFNNDALFILTSSGTTTDIMSGAGANWNSHGEWTFDLSGADQTIGNTWDIVNAGAGYDVDGLNGNDFSVAGATRDGSGVWSGTSGTALFTYTESTGVLAISGIVPEPASLALFGIGGLMMIRRRKA